MSARERQVLTSTEEAYVVSAAKNLLDALNTKDPFYVEMAYDRIEQIAKRSKQFGAEAV